MSVLTKTQLILPETEQLEKKLASLKLTGSPLPLKLGQALDAFKKTDLTPAIGTEFGRGVQLSDWLRAPDSDALFKDLAILVSQRGVVFFRDQKITIDEQKLLGTKLGELSGKPESSKLHVHPLTEEFSELGDEISVITSQRRGTFNESFGDGTKFSEGYEVYDRLSPSFAKYLETLEAVHEARVFQEIANRSNRKLRDGERGSPGNVGEQLEAVHPVIRTNPVTGWKSVFVNRSFTKRIIGLTKDESDRILRYLFDLVSYNHDLQVRFKWEKNSLAIWDNRSNFHAATYDYGVEKRVGDRVVSLGERPYFDPNSKSRREALGLENN